MGEVCIEPEKKWVANLKKVGLLNPIFLKSWKQKIIKSESRVQIKKNALLMSILLEFQR